MLESQKFSLLQLYSKFKSSVRYIQPVTHPHSTLPHPRGKKKTDKNTNKQTKPPGILQSVCAFPGITTRGRYSHILQLSSYLPVFSVFFFFFFFYSLWTKVRNEDRFIPQEKISFPCSFIWLKVNNVTTQDIGPLIPRCKEGRLRLSWGEISSYQERP